MSREPTAIADARLQDIETIAIDAKRALARERPMTDAIWLALLKPRNVILRRYRETLARAADEEGPEIAAQLRLADGRELLGPMGQLLRPAEDVPALVALGETIVAKALLGDNASTAMLLDRVEGRPGTRKDEVDPEEFAKTKEVLGAIETVVRTMNQRPGDTAKDVTPPATVIDIDVESEVKDLYKPNGKGNGHDKV